MAKTTIMQEGPNQSAPAVSPAGSKFLLRNTGAHDATYIVGSTHFALKGRSFVILDSKPTSYTQAIVLQTL